MALRTAGIVDFSGRGPVYVDQPPRHSPRNPVSPTPERDKLLRNLRDGDEVVVMTAGRLGMTIADTLATLAAISARGATLFEIETQRSYAWSPEAVEIAELAARSESQRKREQLMRMRERANELGVERGKATKLSDKKMRELKVDWRNGLLTAAEVAAKYKVPVRTLYNKLGVRGTPRFGGPKGRRDGN